MVAGCFSVEQASSSALGTEVEEQVLVYNYGWELFGCIPVVCGNDNADSWCPFTFFKNEVKLDLAYRKLTDLARARNCELRNVVVNDDREVVFDFYFLPLPWIVHYTDVEVSAQLVKRGSK